MGILSLLIKQRVLPFIAPRESDEEIALIVERKHQLDSSLIAALQFESPHAVTWGSAQLTSAVVHDAARLGSSLTLDEGQGVHRLSQHALALVGMLTMLIAGIITWPADALIFWNRVCLRSDQYPTRTQIASVTMNGHPVSFNSISPPPRIRVPFGQTIAVELSAQGEIPTNGFATLSNLKHEVLTRVKLQPIANQATQFRGNLTQLVESTDVTFALGDAVSRQIAIDVVPLPFVDVDWNIERPKYAVSSSIEESADRGARQRSVLEGSAARLELTCSNKRLQSARMLVADTTYELASAVEPGATATVWSLPTGTPFDCLRESIKYEIQVVDQDGLSLERPILGQLRLVADRAPRLTASAVTRKVLPTAEPRIDYVATDDFGIAAIHATIEISHETEDSSKFEVTEPVPTTSDSPMLIRQGRFPIPLSGYSLRKGDTVQVVLHAEDWRGERPGQRTDSPSITFSVVELAEVLLESSEDDKKSARQLDEILKREQSIRTEKK